ncbi:hypothetical protein SISNIDRAFT_488320 [Sistotremastrum niveocremeum HHB9708]|uniref:Uncharacterized protein n=1 Tax=Sistotremastrum niveocremeum HHB9708 TaxID=1314777 RepID=A0A164RC61_9AGAM|nr:hypothetical protein SISNIDRAFT_488320 [Sistotremastrum niveocremeum HHB9708]
MALTRGPSSKKPCPRDLTSSTELTIIAEDYVARTPEDVQKIIEKALQLRNTRGRKGESDNLLKKYSLRAIQSPLLGLTHSNPYRALATDILHVFEGGGVKHVLGWTVDRLSLKSADPATLQIIDDRFSLLVRWKKNRHHESITELTFADSKCWLSIFNRILPCIWDLKADDMENADEMHPVLLLIRNMSEARALLGVEVVTTEYLELASAKLLDLERSIPAAAEVLKQDCAFPKMHILLTHAIEDIKRKGPLKHMNTIIGEHGHTMFKQDFKQSDGQNVELQITELQENRAVIAHTRHTIESAASPDTQKKKETPSVLLSYTGPRLRSPGPKQLLLQIEENKGSRGFFTNLCQGLLEFFKINLNQPNLAHTNVEQLIQTYTAVNTRFQSFSTLTYEEENIRCAESFHNQERYDVVLVALPDKSYVYARMRLLFSCQVLGQDQQVACVTLLRTVIPPSEHFIGMRRVREDAAGSFIYLKWIVRSVYVQPTFDEEEHDFFVNDVMDSDMYLRHQSLQNEEFM